MFRRFAKSRRTRKARVIAALACGLLWPAILEAQALSRPASEPKLYLLAGTLDGGAGPPCMGWTRLYTPSPGRGLMLVREVLPAARRVYDLQAGLMGTRSAGGEIFLFSPAINTKLVTVLHATDPLRVDAFTFKSPVPQAPLLLPMLLVAVDSPAFGPMLVDAVPVGNGVDWAVVAMVARRAV